MPISADNTARLQFIRSRVIAGTATREEEIEGIRILRQDRISAQVASTSSKAKKAAAAAPIDTAGLLAGLKKANASGDLTGGA